MTAMVLLSCGLAAAVAEVRAGVKSLRFTVFSAEPIENLSYVPVTQASPVPLVFYPTARSPDYFYTGPGPLQFVDATTGSVAVEVEVPPNLRDALLIVSEVASRAPEARRFEVNVVDNSAVRYAPGQLLILNLSGLPLNGMVNRLPTTLVAGMNGPFRADGSATLNLRTAFRGRTYQAYADTLVVDHGNCALLLLLPPYRRGSLEVQSRILLDAPLPGGRHGLH
jgi:hypothetical protein